MQRFFLLFISTLLSISIWAVPAERVRRLITLTDGSQIMGTLVGNEDFAYYLTDEGNIILETPEGFVLTDTTPADLVDLSDEEDTLFVRRAAPVRHAGTRESAALKSTGTQRVPIVLVSFSDLDFSVAEDDESVRAYYEKFCNGTMDGNLYTGHGSHGSIRDYFVEQSDSTFFPEFTVIGPVKLDNGYAYYGKNNGSSKDVNFSTFRSHAIAKALQLQSDWSPFDNDGNGNVDMIFFIYAGLAESNGGGADAMWPKESTSSTTIGGIRFATSGCSNELRPAKWNEDRTEVLQTKPDGVGVFIHELSHALGLPDFYDTRSVAFGMDLWSVMDYGEYGNGGYNPGNYTAYERDFLGWRQMVTIDEPSTLRISCFADGGLGYKVVNEANADEYYVLENRQPKGWDDKIGLRGHGLQVTHVDYKRSNWTSNTVNTDPYHQRMTIIAANNLYLGTNSASNRDEWYACLSGQLYPGDTFNYDLTDETYPAATVFTGDFMSKPIQDISEEADGTITLKYRPLGILNSPSGLEVTNLGDTSFEISWDPVVDASCYNVQLMEGDSLFTQVDSLFATSFRFSNLVPETNYTVRVRAMDDRYLNSLYEEQLVATYATAIQPIAYSEDLTRIYSISGEFVTECFDDEIRRLSLHRGVYILRSSTGKTRKMLIK